MWNVRKILIQMLALLVLLLPISIVLATLPSNTEIAKPEVIGTFTLNVEVVNVKDLYAWQVLMVYDPQTLVLNEFTSGGFVGSKYATETSDPVQDVFVNATDIGSGLLLLGGSLVGNVPGKDGDGLLAKVTFGYLSNDYEPPHLAFDNKPFVTYLLDSNGHVIPTGEETLLSLELESQ
jgi:hypothetical protein